MARPSRCRRICLEPKYDSFAPCEGAKTGRLTLTVDEFEAIRLIDYEDKTQEECAAQMGISRTTVAEIYSHGRKKLADFLVNGRELTIAGGNYRLCDGSAWRCCGKPCGRARASSGHPANFRKEANSMRIAVTYENGTVFQHFGHTEQFKIYDVEDGRITGSQIINTNGKGHGALAGFLTDANVDTLICGGIGGGAQNALAQAGIRLYGGVTGGADDAVNALLSDRLDYQPDVRCNHHGHGEGHSCGEEKHGCGGKE